MPVTCVAYGCYNRGRVGGITYHSFPANEEQRRKWIKAVRRKNWKPAKYSKLCSAHFREEDVDRTSLSCVRLREAAIPTIFPTPSRRSTINRNARSGVSQGNKDTSDEPARKKKYLYTTKEAESDSSALDEWSSQDGTSTSTLFTAEASAAGGSGNIVNCSALDCTNRLDVRKGYRPPDGVTFHRLPAEPVARAAWVAAIARPGWQPTEHAFLCSTHFRETDMDHSSPLVRLREGVVPTVFPARFTTAEVISRRDEIHRELAGVHEELSKLRKERKRLKQSQRRSTRRKQSLSKELEATLPSKRKDKLENELNNETKKLVEAEIGIASSFKQKLACYKKKSELERKLKLLPVPLMLKPGTGLTSIESNLGRGAGSSKGPGVKKQNRPRKIPRDGTEWETEEDEPGNSMTNSKEKDPLEIDEFEVARIKEEIFEVDEFSEVKIEDIEPYDGFAQGKHNFETVFYTPTVIKEEHNEDGEMVSGFNCDTDTAKTDYPHTVIKSEPVEVEEENMKEDDKEENTEEEDKEEEAPCTMEVEQENTTCNDAELLWRCPLVTCPRMFSTQVNMFLHFNSHRAVKGAARASATVPPSAATVSPAGSISFCCVTTTTVSYCTTSSPLVTSVLSTPVSSVTFTTPVALSSTSPPLPASIRITSSTPSPLCITNPKAVTTVLPELEDTNKIPISEFLDLSSSGLKKSNLSSQQQQSKKSASNSHPLQIFVPSKLTTEDLPLCASDDSEMFSISLTQIPQNRRIQLKKKLIDVVDCVKLKKISPEKLMIAYYEHNYDIRSM